MASDVVVESWDFCVWSFHFSDDLGELNHSFPARSKTVILNDFHFQLDHHGKYDLHHFEHFISSCFFRFVQFHEVFRLRYRFNYITKNRSNLISGIVVELGHFERQYSTTKVCQFQWQLGSHIGAKCCLLITAWLLLYHNNKWRIQFLFLGVYRDVPVGLRPEALNSGNFGKIEKKRLTIR